jgi:hypothetical protein
MLGLAPSDHPARARSVGSAASRAASPLVVTPEHATRRNEPLRRRLLASALALAAALVIAPAAGAEQPVSVDGAGTDPHVCVRSRLLLDDPICVFWDPR